MRVLLAPLVLTLCCLALPARAQTLGEMVGEWCLQDLTFSMPVDGSYKYEGWISLPERTEPWEGRMYMTDVFSGAYGLQSMALSPVGDGRLEAVGTLLEFEAYAPDTLLLALRQGLLVGDGIDAAGRTFQVQFRPGSCQSPTS